MPVGVPQPAALAARQQEREGRVEQHAPRVAARQVRRGLPMRGEARRVARDIGLARLGQGRIQRGVRQRLGHARASGRSWTCPGTCHAEARRGSCPPREMDERAAEMAAAAAVDWDAMRQEGALARWRTLCATDAVLKRHLPGATARFAVEQEGVRLVLGFADGSATISEGGDAAAADTAFSAPAGTWAKFLERTPPRHHHNLFALRMRVPEFQATGDELAWAQHCHLLRRALDLGALGAPRRERPRARLAQAEPRHPCAPPAGPRALRHGARRRPRNSCSMARPRAKAAAPSSACTPPAPTAASSTA